MADGTQTDGATVQGPTGRRQVSEETRQRLKELEEWGVDLSLIASSLARTPEQRLAIMLDRLELVNALHRAMHNKRGADSHSDAKA